MITNIRELNNENPAFFSDQNIVNYSNYLQENNIHLLDESHDFIADIPLNKIIGIDQMYGGSSWGQLLNGVCLKRIDNNLKRLEDNPNYYLSDEPKSGVSFVKVGEYYFIRSGKHRTIISRFLAYFNPEIFSEHSPLRNIPVTEYVIDREYAAIEKCIEEVSKYYPNLKFALNHTKDFSESGFLKVSTSGGSNNFSFFSRDEYHELIMELKKPDILKKWKYINSGSYSMPPIYKYIPLKQCLNQLFNVVKTRFGMRI